MDVQIFGVKNDAGTRKALRFFKERRIRVHFVDFKIRGPSKGELRRFAKKHGIDALIDRDAKRFQALGLQAAYYGADRWIEIAVDEPRILRMPLARCGQDVTVGYDDEEWKRWVVDSTRA
jgi:arsenate reductase-like glutaredoxin family protein